MTDTSSLPRARLGRVVHIDASWTERLGVSRLLRPHAPLIIFIVTGAIAVALVARAGRAAYVGLVLMAAVSAAYIATLSRERRRLQAEVGAVAKVLERIQPVADVNEGVPAVLGELLTLFEARSALLVAHDRLHGRLYFWEARRTATAPSLTVKELDAADRETYFFPAPGDRWYAVDGGATVNLPAKFRTDHPFRSMLAVTASSGEQWSDRVFVLDGRSGPRPLRMLQTLARQVTPVLHSLDVLDQLRSHVGAAERARVARDLHDGVIQSMIGLEMQVEVWRRSAGAADPGIAERLAHIQAILKQEILDLRDLIRQLKAPPATGIADILECLASMVEQFRRQSGIAAQFVSEIDDLQLSPRVSNEIARIVQEALVNVRKHSGARNVIVRVSAPPDHWKFEIDDDGRGFGFAGRYSQAELEIGRRGPVVIKERVRSIGGTLAVESTPGHGARVEVWLPRGSNG